MPQNTFCIICEENKENIPIDRNSLLFNFPRDPVLRQKWIQILGLEGTRLKTRARVCEIHFDHTQFGPQKTFLKRGAVPNKKNVSVFPAISKPTLLCGIPHHVSQNLQLRTPCQSKPVLVSNLSPNVSNKPLLDNPISNQSKDNNDIENNRAHSDVVASLIKSNKLLKRRLAWAKRRLQTIRSGTNLNKTFSRSPTFLEFIKSQVKRYTQKTRRFYTSFEKTLGIALFYTCGVTGYKQLLQFGMKLPSEITIRDWIQDFHVNPGINANLFDCIRKITMEKKEIDKDCVICWDEMSVKELIEYSKATDSFEGIVDFGFLRRLESANEVLVLMVHGIHSRWKFPLSFYFSKNATTADHLGIIVTEHINKLFEIGLRVRLGVCDMSFTNQALYRNWNVTADTPSKEFAGQEVFFAHDSPHLVKLVRNNLEKRDFEVDLSLVNNTIAPCKVSWKHIANFYKKDCSVTSRLAPRLTSAHLHLKDYSKMRVRLAVQVLSYSVHCGIIAMVNMKHLPIDAIDTAEFIRRIDEIFDFLNMSLLRETKPSRSAINFFKLSENIDKWMKFVKSIKIPGLKRQPEFVTGLLLTLSSVKCLGKMLKLEGYNCVLTRFLQQDCLEHFFSNVRMKGGHCRNPTARQFRLSFRYLFFTSLMSFPSNGNVEDVFQKKIENMQIAFPFENVVKTKKITTIESSVPEIDEDSAPLRDFFSTLKVHRFKPGQFQQDIVAKYAGAACIRAISRITKCETCNNEMLVNRAKVEFAEDDLLIDLKQLANYGEGLYYLEHSTAEVFKTINSKFLDYINSTLNERGTSIVSTLFCEVNRDVIVKSWIRSGCCDHRERIIKYFLRAKLFRIIRDKNCSVRKIKSWDQSRRELRNQ